MRPQKRANPGQGNVVEGPAANQTGHGHKVNAGADDQGPEANQRVGGQNRRADDQDRGREVGTSRDQRRGEDRGAGQGDTGRGHVDTGGHGQGIKVGGRAVTLRTRYNGTGTGDQGGVTIFFLSFIQDF